MDSFKAKRLARVIPDVELAAARHVRAVVKGEHPDADVKWSEVSGRTRCCLTIVQGSMAAARAKTMSEAPRQLGVIVVHKRLEDTPQNRLSWEQEAARLAAEREAKAIEAVARPAVSWGEDKPDGT